MAWDIFNKPLLDQAGMSMFVGRIRPGISKKTGITILCLGAILSGLLSVGCGNDNPSGAGGFIPAGLIATWTYESVTINGETAELRAALEWQPESVTAQFTLSLDATFVQEELDSTGTIVWTQQGNFSMTLTHFTITVTSDSDGPVDPPLVVSGSGTLSGNKLTMTVVEEGDTYVFVATK